MFLVNEKQLPSGNNVDWFEPVCVDIFVVGINSRIALDKWTIKFNSSPGAAKSVVLNNVLTTSFGQIATEIVLQII